MNESALFQQLKSRIPGRYTRFENVVSSGIADVHVTIAGCDFWLELKILKAGKITLLPSQRVWLRERENAYVLCGGGVVELYHPDEVFAQPYKRTSKGGLLFDLANLTPVATGWDNIRRHLIGRTRTNPARG